MKMYNWIACCMDNHPEVPRKEWESIQDMVKQKVVEDHFFSDAAWMVMEQECDKVIDQYS